MVRPNDTSACARAFRFAKRVLIPDISRDPFSGAYLALAQGPGLRAMQATPILDKYGVVVGVLCTHFGTPYHLCRAETVALDQCALRAARLIQAGWMYQPLL